MNVVTLTVVMNNVCPKDELLILGLMSGTSLDGLDVAYCRFRSPRHCELLAAYTFPYPEEWRQRLASLDKASAYEYAMANVELGHYMGQRVNEFRSMHLGHVDYVASHGHTVFHQPHLGLTTQIGDGDALAAETQLPVVFNFRTLDVALGGQGAPLVPIGDELLFADYEACLNLGGIGNISFTEGGCRKAFDIVPCNMVLNYLAGLKGLSYDCDGTLAAAGSINVTLLDKMNRLEYYSQPAPKSLGKEWFLAHFLPLLQGGECVENLLRTVVEHVAMQVAAVVKKHGIGTMVVTGGGALNGFLVERIRHHAQGCSVTVPNKEMVEYKEAVIFALLGYLRVTVQVNTLASVTGARCDSVGGCLSGLLI